MIRKLSPDELPLAKSLLENYKLPTDDLSSHNVLLFGYFSTDEFLGCVGIEEYDDALLLRSLAVTKSKGTCGIGTMLAEYVGRYAFKHGKKTIYLLTDSADGFFSRLGFKACDRALAPSTIQQTRQCRELCAESAVLMSYEF
ncbi:MAG: GNAT family N-acetyltransferase [Balneolaceae bacterium]|nr:GNAT family N-acetyltransferase [Balneolaceae bacterium]